MCSNLSSRAFPVSIYYDQALQPGNPPTGWADAARQAIEREGAKLSAYTDWVNARRTLASITGLDPAKRDAFDARLDTARRALRNDAALDPATRLDLSSAASDIEEAKADLAKQAVEQAGQQVEAAATSVADPEALQKLQHSAAEVARADELLQVRDYAGYREAYDSAELAYVQGVSQELLTQLQRQIDAVNAGADLQNVRPVQVPPILRDNLSRALKATDLRSARAYYLAARGTLHVAEDVQVQNVIGPLQSMTGDIPPAGVQPSQPLVPKLTIENPEGLTKQVKQLDLAVDIAAILSAGVLGVLLVWAPNPGWGQWTDMFAALLWGLGLYSVGTSTFEGILGVRTKLSP
jgi:hypothetical protein